MNEPTAAERAIRERIQRQGRIPFAEFMELALYHPADGYYSSEKPFGAAGDYYTSPAVHPAFGALLAVQLFRMWQLVEEPSKFTVVEMGAGNGLLADDILEYADGISDEFARSMRYVCIDRYRSSDPNRGQGSDSENIDRVIATGLPFTGITGCLLSNEFVDAFPVHRFKVVQGEVLEVFVTVDKSGNFDEVLDNPSTPLLEDRLSRLDFALEDGQRGEINLRVESWLGDVTKALDRGSVITIDYGHLATELYSPLRRFGTLQTYYRHTDGGSPYQRIGRQDITAQVDFSLLQVEGQAAGLNTIEYATQADFLSSLGIQEMMHRMRSTTMSQYERNANMLGLRELVKPDGLGGFKALVQEKGTGIAVPKELMPPDELLQRLKLPLLSSRHMPLMEGRYPHTVWEMPTLWGIENEAKGGSTPPN